jgi:hypothetical protein
MILFERTEKYDKKVSGLDFTNPDIFFPISVLIKMFF